MKRKIIAAGIAVLIAAANISAAMPENPSVAARQLPLEGERKIVADYAAPEGEHWSAAEKRVNATPYAVRTVKDADPYDYPSVGCADSSPDKGSRGADDAGAADKAGGASPSPTGGSQGERIATPSCATVRNDTEIIADDEASEGVRFTATAYCPCAKCCGQYANSRPIDENGEPIVYTATGTRATQGRTIAVDPAVIPYGTHVLIDGAEYVAEDCGCGVRGHHIDVYFADHDAAKAFGVQTVTVEVMG